MKNKLIDLNNHLFEQMERLNDDELSNEQLEKEISRAKAMSSIAENIIDNASLALKASQYNNEYPRHVAMPEMIGIEKK